MRKAILFILFAILIAIISMNHSTQSEMRFSKLSGYQYKDVRLIDPIDAVDSGPELVAILSRFAKNTLQIRVDFLQLEIDKDIVLSLYIDSIPGGSKIANSTVFDNDKFAWDYLIEYSNASLVFSGYDYKYPELRLATNLIHNYIEFSIDISNLNIDIRSSRLVVQARRQNSNVIADRTEPINLSGTPPAPITIQFLFWNILDSSTPATILRSWAGAHTGPQSSRHGLSYLLSASRSWKISINICQLHDPDIVFALKYVHGLESVRALVEDGLVYGVYCEGVNDYAQLLDDSELFNYSFSVDSWIKYLLANYNLPDGDSQFSIGGDLSTSVMGNPETVVALFSYIADHPWIQPVSVPKYSLLNSTKYLPPTLPEIGLDEIPYSNTGVPIASGITTSTLQALISYELSIVPNNPISQMAHLTFINFLKTEKPNISTARGSYLIQLGHLIEAAYWAENATEVSTCDKDIDWDGYPECILSSANVFMSFELEGGYLAFAFTRNDTGVHQITGPTTQFNVLRSDPSLLIPNRGIAGDPGQIIGAFADPQLSCQLYNGNTFPKRIELVRQDGDVHKSFAIQDDGIHIAILNTKPEEQPIIRLPLVLDPWRIYFPDQAINYQSRLLDTKWLWEVPNEITIGIASNTNSVRNSFNATHYAFQYPEDPNFDYTPGHLLPIPMALIEFNNQSTVVIDLEIDLKQ